MYLIYGESFRLIEEEIEKIIKTETNVITMDLAVCSMEDVLTEAMYVSLFQEKKFIIVKNALLFTSVKASEEEVKLLLDYLAHPVSLTTILFTTYEKIDARKKITKEFSEKYKVIAVGHLSASDLLNKIREYVFFNEYKMDTETMQYIISCCGNCYDLIYNEIHKLFLYFMVPQKIELKDVKKIVSRSIQDNHFKFVEFVISKDIKSALSVLEDLYLLKTDPIQLLILLAREYRLMYSTKVLSSLGYPKNSVSKQLGLQDWQTEKLLKSSALYYKEDIGNCIKKLASIDMKIKKGEGDRFLEIKTFMLSLL